MLRVMCKSKIHNAVVTMAKVNYGGSIVIDSALIRRANIIPNEMVLVVNLRTGARFETYTVEGEKNSGIIGLLGGAAMLGKTGDKLIIMSSCLLDDKAAKKHKPIYVYTGENNKIEKITGTKNQVRRI